MIELKIARVFSKKIKEALKESFADFTRQQQVVDSYITFEKENGISFNDLMVEAYNEVTNSSYDPHRDKKDKYVSLKIVKAWAIAEAFEFNTKYLVPPSQKAANDAFCLHEIRYDLINRKAVSEDGEYSKACTLIREWEDELRETAGMQDDTYFRESFYQEIGQENWPGPTPEPVFGFLYTTYEEGEEVWKDLNVNANSIDEALAIALPLFPENTQFVDTDVSNGDNFIDISEKEEFQKWF